MSIQSTRNSMKSRRIRLFLSHLAVSALLIAVCLLTILLVWYPDGLAELEGIYSVLTVMIGVDVAAGPLCTLVVAAPAKSTRELGRDLAVIAGVQVLALGYALFTTVSARPAFVVYSFGQFEIERANELSPEMLAKAAAPEYSHVSWTGPVYVEARLPSSKEAADEIVLSTVNGGRALHDMPDRYLAWPAPGNDAARKSVPATDLAFNPRLRAAVEKILSKQGVPESDAMIVPIIGKASRGSVVLRRHDGAILGIVPSISP